MDTPTEQNDRVSMPQEEKLSQGIVHKFLLFICELVQRGCETGPEKKKLISNQITVIQTVEGF